MTDAQTVLISIAGRQSNTDGDDESISLMTVGQLSRTKKGWRLQYEETSPESVVSSRVKLDMAGDRVYMERDGELVSYMEFEKNQRFSGEYHTPYGTLKMGIYATEVFVDVEAGVVRLQYQLDLQGHFAAMHKLEITFQPHG